MIARGVWVTALVSVALFSAWSLAADLAPGEVEMPAGFGARVAFGLKDQEPTVWSGTAKASFCTIQELRGVLFDRDDEVSDVNAWKCKTRPEVRLARGVEEPETPDDTLDGKVVPVGLLMRVEGTEHSAVEISTKLGDFDFLLGELQLGKKLTRLEGKVSVEGTPWAVRLSGERGDADYPSLACDADGKVWLVWMSYEDGADTIWARRFDGAKWSGPMKVSDAPGDCLQPAVAADSTGVWVVWAAQAQGN
ncbi:MAG: hypothetical protein FJ272_04055, partial [Planctomycetes bacterium]|nr:hypothetical protein [Planctomycetota bacterium]